MSYDFRLFLPREGEDPLEIARQDEEVDELLSAPINPDREGIKQRTAKKLMASSPELHPFEFGYDEIAGFEGISIEEAKLKYRHIELNGSENGNGLQIQLFDNEASLTVPYFHKGAQAEQIFKEIWSYLRIIQNETGYVVYDPQLDAILDLENGYTESLEVYRSI